MGDPFEQSGADGQHERFSPRLRTPQDAAKQNPHGQSPFYSQFDHLSQQPQRSGTSGAIQYGTTAFDMSSMGGALPQPGGRFPVQRGPPVDVAALRAQSQQFLAQQYHAAQMQHSVAHRPQGLDLQPPGPQPSVDIYGYGMSTPHYSPVGSGFAGQAFPMNVPLGVEFNSFIRRTSETAAVPAYPRGPPRKPKQSGHALWVGNLPPAATIMDLKDHFSRDATKDIESLFLISKSNCAFVNYRTEATCVAAMNRFHDSRFHGVRLVCRLRRGSTSNADPHTVVSESPTTSASDAIQRSEDDALPDGMPGGDETPVIVGQGRPDETGPREEKKVPEKFFIVKSLTVQDLEASVRNGTWATQAHNEQVLNSAYDMADNVYLIFSANKSGEYFGYARMASLISGEPVKLESVAEQVEGSGSAAGTPQSIPTPATETAPRGHIIDDSARGTIFWEADLSDNEPDSVVKESGDNGEGQWGRQFQIEWVSTARLPFFRTRGLRNPWNANREVKIARDGTELEPSVGRRLVTMFHRPPPVQSGLPPMLLPGMSYR